MHALTVLALIVAAGCGGSRVAQPAPATADQTVRDAVVLVCATPERAKPDARGDVSMSDAIAGHLTDGIGNDHVLTTVEGWKTNGIDPKQLDGLIQEAGITTCSLRDTLGDR